MSLTTLMLSPVALVPTLAFLFILDRLDSFRLVSLRAALLVLLAGGATAIISYFVNGAVMDALGTDFVTYTRYGAPVVEECLIACVMIYLFVYARIGFLIDAAIFGFAAGTGFALLENLYFLYAFPEANLGVWIIRGFGTAMMHGGATAIFGVLSQTWAECHIKFAPSLYVPGLTAAIFLHSLFNHLLPSPLVATAITMLLTPLALFVVFAKSEHRVHSWILQDHTSNESLLASMNAGFSLTPAGRFIATLGSKFREEHANDIYTYMRLHTELVLRAEDLLLAREKGAQPEISEIDRQRFHHLHDLESKIGRTALLALWPHLHYSRQELAELYEFESRAKTSNWSRR